MRVKVRLFAILRERAGWRERELDLPPDSSIEDAWLAMVDLSPALGPSRESVRFARNRQYAAADERLADGDELALIPPVAGGAAAGGGAVGGSGDANGDLLRCELREQLIEDELLAELRATVPTPADGALVIFVGQTRETAGTPAPGEEAAAASHAGELVTGLDYEAFEEMALETLRTIGAEIAARFSVRRLAMIHRVGRVAVGEPSVVIAAAAAHRGAAFDATRYAIEELKARAPIWKAEHFADGSVWIGAPARTSSEGEG
jgi:molybdopterin synthase catalytic subunit/molybdopterin converting factor small subunit